MADRKAVGHYYNIDFLNVVFAVSSLALFFSSLWMVWHDYDREWKNYQRRFAQLELEVTRQRLEQVERSVDRDRLAQLEARRKQAEQQVAANRAQIDALQRQLQDLEARIYLASQDAQFTKATYDAERYDYEVLRLKNPQRAEQVKPAIDRMFERLQQQNLEVEKLTAERDRLRAQMAALTRALDEVSSELSELLAEKSRLERRLTAIRPDAVKTYFLNAPLVDFMAPTLRIRQVITPDIVDDVNFTRVPKMDRCMTCHLAIDRDGYEQYPQPFRTHPNLSVYVGAASPHPVERFGCTVCHEGMGQSVSFRDAAHTPADEDQRREWEARYHWEPAHLWDYPMLPRGMTEASCAKCHKDTIYVPKAQVLNTAYGLYERAGCYACHKTRGFEHLRKPGPDLRRIQAKLTPAWVERWLRNPRAIKPSTWMPRFWYLSNSSAPEDARRNEVEIDAAVAYLFANSEPYTFADPTPPRGDPERGRRLVLSVGCLACHVIEEPRAAAGPRRTFGQPLQNIGTKTSYAWLYNWVRDPKHFSPGTYMPNLRLTDQEAADVAAFLTTLKGPAGESDRAQYEARDVDEVLLDYLRSVMPTEEARATIAKLDADGRRLELGRRVISRYGCYSCHEIKGFEAAQPIGIELSEEGSKLISQLDFAFVDIPHTKIDWFRQKLLDPRIFDRNRVLQPLEKLRMPDFGLTPEEARYLVTAIMSFQRDVQPLAARAPRSARHDALNLGRNLVRRRNCIACHEIEGDGGDYRQLVEDPSLAPPLLTPEGAKVKPDWLYAFLRSPITIRPWLTVRMPTFGLDDQSWNQVLGYFAAISNAVGPFRTFDVVPTSEQVAGGRQLFELLRCQQCHVLGAIPKDQPTANLAPDLRMAPERLQPDWILEWLKNPTAIQPGTRMPAFWPNYPQSFYPQFGGDAERQIRAIRDYLMTLRGGPSPRRPTALVAPN
jgi:mono/diheme cytochrome c family protein